MKLRKVDSQSDAFDFVIPLSRQAVETVKAAMELAGACKYLFPRRGIRIARSPATP
jgi:uroporphyrinogen-III synthase